ncbi:MAG: fenitrothion hydrolase [Solirubrobacteraceae bacterium]
MRPLRTLLAGTGLALLGQALLPGLAGAHGIGGVTDLPIPTWLFAWAASIVLVASFVALATLWPEPRLEQTRERVVATVPRLLEPTAGGLGIAVFVLVVYAGLAGEQDEATRNLAPVAVFVFFWVGLAAGSALFGDVFRALNPWRATARAVAWLGRRAGTRMRPPLRYPVRLGHWPAALGILAFAWVELVLPSRDVPSTLAILVLACAATQLLAMAAFGIETWERHGDPLAVYFGLFAKLSPVHWEGGRLSLRRPLEGVAHMEVLPGTIALLAVMIGSTSFDGLSQSTAWTEALPGWQTSLSGLGGEGALELINTLGLLAMILLVTAIYRLGILGMRSIDHRFTTPELARRFAHTLVPIALAYVMAHYFTFLVYQGQTIGYLISDPLGTGANLFGTAHASIDYGFISASQAWYVDVAALLAGHVCGLVLAHDRAVALYRHQWNAGGASVGPGGVLVLDGRASDAIRSQYWMLGVMVAFTCLGLWLLSAAA